MQSCFGHHFMLVLEKFDIDLKNYLHLNHNQLIWKERVRIAYDIIQCLYNIRQKDKIHRDLHSGNI